MANIELSDAAHEIFAPEPFLVPAGTAVGAAMRLRLAVKKPYCWAA